MPKKKNIPMVNKISGRGVHGGPCVRRNGFLGDRAFAGP